MNLFTSRSVFIKVFCVGFIAYLHFANSGGGANSAEGADSVKGARRLGGTWVRWTGLEDSNPDLQHILSRIHDKTQVELSVGDLVTLENRRLATSQFVMMNQVQAGLPVQSRNIRIWTSLKTGRLIQAEALVEKLLHPPDYSPNFIPVDSQTTMRALRSVVNAHRDDPFIREVQWRDYWENAGPVRRVIAKGKHGKHRVTIALDSGRVLSSAYDEFPQGDLEFSVPVQVYPIYEEVEETHEMLERIPSELRYLNSSVHRVSEDPYGPLKTIRYDFEKYDPLLGLTVAGRQQGFWAMGFVKHAASRIIASLPLVNNSFSNGGVVLDGRYATVNLYPDAVKNFQHLSFTPEMSPAFLPTFQEMPDKPGHEEMVPSGSFLGRPIHSLDEAWKRLARRLPDHDPESYANDGFDEMQVYWAVTRLFESLTSMGFTDPDLSTRPFHAFLYYPDISYRDNAFYTDDTINFTTYSPKSSNMARDNTTIWHELGHGVMDRLMGDHIQLADTGGLSEGMADFVASLVVSDVTGGLSFSGKQSMRILNNTGFHLTNEVHDDGEAYGGAMNDLLEAAVAHFGREGLVKVTDLTLEAMRLSRNHPGLTANDWFDRMLFADDLGHTPVRCSGELRALILKSLNGRNFEFGSDAPANFEVRNGDEELTATGPGSRPRPIPLSLAETATASFTLKLRLIQGSHFKFEYPVKLRVEHRQSPLQGAVHWVGEENNPQEYVLNSQSDLLSVPLTVTGKCDYVNRPDGSCVDYVHFQVFGRSDTKPVAKKRFYLRVMPK